MNPLVRKLIGLAALTAAVVAIVATIMPDVPVEDTAPAPAAAVSATPDAAGSPPSTSVEPAGAAGQFLRTTERASIAAVVADHDPMARGTSVRLAIEVEMVPGMHVNANPPTHDWLIPVQASVAGVEGVRLIEAFYPEAESRKFPYDDVPYRVYEGSFVIGVTLGIDADLVGGGRQLEVLLDYQACNDEACFAPAKTSFKLPVMIVTDVADAVEVTSPILDRAPFPPGAAPTPGRR